MSNHDPIDEFSTGVGDDHVDAAERTVLGQPYPDVPRDRDRPSEQHPFRSHLRPVNVVEDVLLGRLTEHFEFVDLTRLGSTFEVVQGGNSELRVERLCSLRTDSFDTGDRPDPLQFVPLVHVLDCFGEGLDVPGGSAVRAWFVPPPESRGNRRSLSVAPLRPGSSLGDTPVPIVFDGGTRLAIRRCSDPARRVAALGAVPARSGGRGEQVARSTDGIPTRWEQPSQGMCVCH